MGLRITNELELAVAFTVSMRHNKNTVRAMVPMKETIQILTLTVPLEAIRRSPSMLLLVSTLQASKQILFLKMQTLISAGSNARSWLQVAPLL